ncbi:MAG: hypothetical protein AAF573_14635 [Bacteroidota bacterium]
MKNLALLFCLSIFIFGSCTSSRSSSIFTSKKFRNKKIAIVPFEIHTSVKQLPKGVTIAMLEKAERRKGLIMQRDLYRYLLRASAKVKPFRRAKFQDVNTTNKIFKSLDMDLEKIHKTSKTELARLLGVDAIIYGNIYQFKQKLRIQGDDFVKYAGVNNKIATVLYAYDKKRGQIQWKYDSSQSGFPSDYGPDVAKGLLRKAARNFPM